jgi:hypothetical protein
MEYVAFEVDRANIGRHSERQSPNQERTAAALTVRWNRVFIERGVPLRICPAYRHTGNYWLAAEQALHVADVAKNLSDTLSRGFAVFTVEAFLAWLSAAKTALTAPSAVPVGRRATPGAVIDLNVAGGPPPAVTSDERWMFDTFALPRVRVVWKIDLEVQGGGRLDNSPKGREGGWGSASRLMKKHYGGQWTARAMSTLEGVAKVVGKEVRRETR